MLRITVVFPAPVAAEERHRLARRDVDRHAVQHVAVLVVRVDAVDGEARHHTAPR
jgi:hypothetical protein